jgi:hypothetical protein
MREVPNNYTFIYGKMTEKPYLNDYFGTFIAREHGHVKPLKRSK